MTTESQHFTIRVAPVPLVGHLLKLDGVAVPYQLGTPREKWAILADGGAGPQIIALFDAEEPAREAAEALGRRMHGLLSGLVLVADNDDAGEVRQ